MIPEYADLSIILGGPARIKIVQGSHADSCISSKEFGNDNTVSLYVPELFSIKEIHIIY